MDFLGQGKKGLKNSGGLRDKIRDNSGPDLCRKITNPRRPPTLLLRYELSD